MTTTAISTLDPISTSEKKILRKELYYLLITLASPIIVQNLIGNSLVMIDTVMISRLGEAAVAAVGIAGRLQFIFMLLSFGFYSGAGVFIAQYNGSGQRQKIRSVMALQIAIGVSIAALFTIIGLFFGEFYLRIFSKDPEVIKLGASYLKYLCLGFIPQAIGYAFVVSLRSIKDPVLPMLVSIVALLVNTFLNYGLIFGKLGLPMLGVKGAAIATTIARLIELTLILMPIYFGTRGVLKFHIKDLFSISQEFTQKYIQVSWPIIMGEAMWGLGSVMYALAYSKLGTTAFASSQMAQIVNDIMLVASFGLASSVGTILGNKLGEGKVKEAIYFSRQIMILSIVIGLATGAILMATMPLVPKIFGISGETASNVVKILTVRAAINCLVTFNWTNVTGILRSGGDTVVALAIDVGPMWMVGVPLAFLGALYFQWPVHIVVMSSFVDELLKFVLGFPRALKNKWANELTR